MAEAPNAQTKSNLKPADKLPSLEEAGGPKETVLDLEVVPKPLYGESDKAPKVDSKALPPLPEEEPDSEVKEDAVPEPKVETSQPTPQPTSQTLKAAEKAKAAQQASPPVPVQEPEQVKHKRRFRFLPIRGCKVPGCGCTTITCGSSLIFLVVVVVAIFLLIQSPPNIIDPVKDWVNVDLQTITYDGTTVEGTLLEVSQQVEDFTVGENTLVLSESQLKALVDDKYPNLTPFSDLFIDVKPGLLKFFWDVDGDPERFVWLTVEIVTNTEQQVLFSKIGTERIGLPGFLIDFASNALLSVVNISGSELNTTGLAKLILPLSENVNITKVEFNEDEVELTIDLMTGLESILNND